MMRRFGLNNSRSCRFRFSLLSLFVWVGLVFTLLIAIDTVFVTVIDGNAKFRILLTMVNKEDVGIANVDVFLINIGGTSDEVPSTSGNYTTIAQATSDGNGVVALDSRLPVSSRASVFRATETVVFPNDFWFLIRAEVNGRRESRSIPLNGLFGKRLRCGTPHRTLTAVVNVDFPLTIGNNGGNREQKREQRCP